MKPLLRVSHPGFLESAFRPRYPEPRGEQERGHQLAACYDVKSVRGELTVAVDLPGVDEDEIGIDVVGDVLHVVVERGFDLDNEDPEDYTKIGRPYGVFTCTVPLPESAEAEAMTAKYKRGVLKVRIPLVEDKR